MESILLITDDLKRSRSFAQNLGEGLPCEIRLFYANDILARKRQAILIDIQDMSREAIDRLKQVVKTVRCDAPLFVLLHGDTHRGRLMAVGLGATQTLILPVDVLRLRAILGASPAVSHVISTAAGSSSSARAKRAAAEARDFFITTFVPDQPIRPGMINTGANLIEHAIRDVGIRDWIQAVRQFDDATHQHCLLVAGLAAGFATHLSLRESDRHRVARAALLHGVGKIHIPPAILNKPGRLNDAEMAIVRMHPECGHVMLVGRGFEDELLTVVRSHHEMLDGSGYPDGLAGETIPDLVRLVTVCDIYAALIERRSYKPPMCAAKAFGILEDMTDRIDPVLVETFRPVAVALNAQPWQFVASSDIGGCTSS